MTSTVQYILYTFIFLPIIITGGKHAFPSSSMCTSQVTPELSPRHWTKSPAFLGTTVFYKPHVIVVSYSVSIDHQVEKVRHGYFDDAAFAFGLRVRVW